MASKTVSVFGVVFQVTSSTFMDSLVCPTCGVSECHPFKESKICIRGYKVDNFSQCLVCAGYYDPWTLEIIPKEQRRKSIEAYGWFE
jgi:hypothetical protein